MKGKGSALTGKDAGPRYMLNLRVKYFALEMVIPPDKAYFFTNFHFTLISLPAPLEQCPWTGRRKGGVVGNAKGLTHIGIIRHHCNLLCRHRPACSSARQLLPTVFLQPRFVPDGVTTSLMKGGCIATFTAALLQQQYDCLNTMDQAAGCHEANTWEKSLSINLRVRRLVNWLKSYSGSLCYGRKAKLYLAAPDFTQKTAVVALLFFRYLFVQPYCANRSVPVR